MTNEGKQFRQLKLDAKVENVSGSGYSWDADAIASIETTVRLGGRFDREQVRLLITGVVDQLVVAFDEGEGPQPVDAAVAEPDAEQPA